MKHILLSASLFLCLVLAACGPASASPAAAVPTEATTSAPPPIATLTATAAPTSSPTPTLAPTPTSAPGEISSATQLGLAADFVPISSDDLTLKYPPKLVFAGGIKEQKDQIYPLGLIPWFQFPLKARFGFTNNDNTQFVYGYTVVLATSKDQASFDALFVSEFFAKMRISVLQWTPNAAKIKNVAVGDKSVGVTSSPNVDGSAWNLNVVSFRLGDTGAFVFTLYPASASAPIDIVKLAQVYAGALK
jgi:hypothetical protein